MKRTFALAAVLSLFGGSALADCPGHVSASAPMPAGDQQVSTMPAPAPTTSATAVSGTVLSAQTEATPATAPVVE